MSNSLHICFVSPHAYPLLVNNTDLKFVGGAEVQQCITAKALKRSGYKVSMVCLDYGQPDNLVIDGIQVCKAHKPDAGIPVVRFLYPRLTSFWNAMKIINADIYYQRCASMHTGLVAFFCRLNAKKMIFSVASDTDLIPGHQLIKYKRDKLIYGWGLKHADVIIAQSPRQQELCKRNYNRESVCIGSSYELYPSKKMDDKHADVLWVGTVKPIKRPEIFLELAQKMPEFSFTMVGGPVGGNYSDSYYCGIKRQAVNISNLEFVGFVPYTEIDKHFDAARLLVNTSAFEGFPNTFLQSWVRGVPTVSFFDPNKVFEGKEVGCIVKSTDELIFKIKELLSSREKYRTWSELCKQYAEEFHSPEKIAEDYSKVFTKLIG